MGFFSRLFGTDKDRRTPIRRRKPPKPATTGSQQAKAPVTFGKADVKRKYQRARKS